MASATLSSECGWFSVPGGAAGSTLLCQYGPTIAVDIGFDPAHKPGEPDLPPIAGIKGVPALVDTGAFASCIDSLLATQLNLPIIDRRIVSGIGGPQEVNFHLAQVCVPSLRFTQYGMFAGVHLAAGGQPHQALLGRTFLRHHTMLYEGPSGQVTISRANAPPPPASSPTSPVSPVEPPQPAQPPA
jgi:hypothetical protein